MNIKLFINNTTLDATKDMIDTIDNSDDFIEHIVVVPDKYSLQMEKLLLDTLPRKALFNVRVVGLTSLANDIFKKLNIKVDVLTSGECLLITEKAIENVKKDFLTLKKSNIAFCYEINKIIAQLKSSNISIEDLEGKKDINGMAGAKYHDITLIFKEYQNLLQGRIDANERLSLLCNVIKENKILNNTIFYFAQFESFTAEAYKLIKVLVENSKQVNISLTQSISIGNDYIYEKDIYQKIINITKELNCPVDVINKKGEFTNEKTAIVRGLYSYEKVSCENRGFYNIFVANNITEEVTAVAKLIYYFSTQGYIYKDFIVMTSDLEKYQNFIDIIFKKFNFPYYIDSSITADKTLLGILINNFFETVIMGYPNDKLISLFSNILLKRNEELIERCQSYNIEGKYKYKKYLEKDFSYNKYLQNIEKAKKAKDFSEIIRNICQDVKDNFESIMDSLQEKKLLKEKNINLQIYDIIEETLELIEKYQTEEISANDYLKKFNLLMSFKQVSTVPTFVDGIFVGDATTSSCLNSKVIFILGGQNLPVTNNDNGLLNDEDIKYSFNNKKIEPTIRMINRRNRFKLFNLLSLAEDKLFIFYQALNEDGKKTELPTFVDSLNNIFSTQPIRISNVFNLNSAKELKRIKLSLGNKNNFIDEYFSKVDENIKTLYDFSKDLPFKDLIINKDHISQNPYQLYFYNDKIRVTQIEQYFSCPFKHFLNYGLKVQEKKTYQFDVRDIGNICHRCAELLVKKIINNNYNFDIDLKEFVDKNFENIIKDEQLEEKIDATDEKFSLKRYIKKQLYSISKDIVREIKSSEFKPKFIEMKFDNLTLGNKEKIRMIGKADRVDVCQNYFRIIDYKTGKTGNLLKELYFGNKLQLFLYQKTVKEKINKKPAGIFYFNAKFDYAQNDDDKVILKGIVKNDDEVIEMIDKNLISEGKSSILNISTSSTGRNGKYKGNAIAKEDLDVYENYAKMIADKAVDEILEGYIQPKPCESACDNCQFLSICLFEKVNGERKQSKIGEFKKKENE